MTPVEIALAFAVLLALVTVGVVVVLRLQAQSAERASTFAYGSPLSGERSGPPGPPSVPLRARTGPERDHRADGRGRLRPRPHTNRSRRR